MSEVAADERFPRKRPLLRVAPSEGNLLEQVGLALNSTLELWEVLRELAGVVLRETGAYRCSAFLLDGDVLRPAAAIGVAEDEHLWERFQEMGPVDLSSVPHGWDLMAAGRAVKILEAATSPLIPDEWVKAFSLQSLVLVPLHVTREPCGLLSVDFQEHRDPGPGEVRFLEAVASHAGVAVRNARLYEATRRRSQLQEGLARASTALVSPATRGEVGRLLVDAFTDLFEPRLCALGLVTDHHSSIEIVASDGVDLDEAIPVSSVPDAVKQKLSTDWDGKTPLELEDHPWLGAALGGDRAGADSYLLFPLKSRRHLLGGILLGFAGKAALDTAELSIADSLVDIATAALERGILSEKLEQELHHTRALYELGNVLAERADCQALATHLNRLLAGSGITVTGISLRDRNLAEKLGGLHPTPEERQAWRGRPQAALLADDILSVPMLLGKRVVGGVHVRPSEPALEQQPFLETLARGVAEVASRGALRAAVEEADRERAVTAERGRIAADLHDTAGQSLVAISLMARREAEHLPAESPWRQRFLRLAELSDNGKWEIDRAVQALAFFPAARRGLAPSLRSLARSFQNDSGIDALVDVEGTPVRVSPQLERALYRIAHEALTNAWKHSRCAVVRLQLEFAHQEIILRITDDGLGRGTPAQRARTRTGISSMRRAVNEVGGRLRIADVKPHGTVVDARVPKAGQ